jgi:CMP-N-acetylneuraminic acid synthetase
MRTVAVIAVKANSIRTPNKNLRPFYQDKSLLKIKIEQCQKSGAFEDVYVSSDSLEAGDIARACGATFMLREPHLCRDDTPWSDVLEGILNSFPIGDDTFVAWCPVTSPLFDRYHDVVAHLKNNSQHDSVVTVTPLKHYFLNADYLPINHQWGPWHTYSQGMRPVYQLNVACMLAKKATIIRNQYLIGNNPAFMDTTVTEGIDIDTMEEFDIASLLYSRRQQTET